MARREAVGHSARGVYYARVPRVIVRAAARAGLTSTERAVLDELLGSVLGPDERYRVVGVDFAVRVFANRCKLSKSDVDRAVRRLLDCGLVVRRPDGERRRAFRYQVVHPAWWPGETWDERDLGGLPPDVVPGWERPLLRLPRAPQVVHNTPERVPARGDTRARAPLPFRKNRRTWNPREADVTRFYVRQGNRSYQLHEAVAMALDKLFPGWEALDLADWQAIPSHAVAAVRDLIARAFTGSEGWSLDRFRMAMSVAWKAQDRRRADRELEATAAAERAEAAWRERASELLVRWRRVTASDGRDYPDAARAIARIEAGELAELEVAEALVDIAEEAQLLAQAAPVAPDAARPATAPLALPAADAEPATADSAPDAPATVCAPLDLPNRWRRPVPLPSPVPADVPPDQVAERAAVVLGVLEAALTGGPLDPTTRLLTRASLDHLRARLAEHAPPRTLALVLRQAESVLARLPVPSLPLGEAFPGVGDGAVEAGLQGLAGREDSQVFGDVDPALVELQQLDLLPLLPRAEDDPQRWRLARLKLMPGEPPEVELHLPFVLGAEVTELQVDRDEPSELPVVEEQVDVEVVVVDLHPLLPGDEREAGPELQEELLDVAEDGVLEVALQVAVVQPQEVEEVRVFQEEGRRHHLLLAKPGEIVPDGLLGLPGDGAPLVEHRTHPLLELPGGPALEAAQLGVEVPLEGVVDVSQRLDVRPGQFSPQRGENPLIRKSLRDAETMSELLSAPAAPVALGELARERVDDLLAVCRALTPEHLGVETAPDLPVQERQLGVHRRRDPLAGAVDQRLDVEQERVVGGRQRVHGSSVEHSFAMAHRVPWPPRCRSDPPPWRT